jgi:hypothetical protein
MLTYFPSRKRPFGEYPRPAVAVKLSSLALPRDMDRGGQKIF